MTCPCRSRPRKNWPQRKSAARSASVTMRSICGRNRYLERTGHEERIDHRSHADRGLLERPTVHEGVVARAMEKKGIISDRCELNRQIKSDNALLRELRGQVKKLAQAVKNTIPALAEAMENLRKNLLLFSYQLGYLRKGKERLNTSLNTLRPALAQYNQLAKDIRDKTKERRSLLSEKKALSAVHVFRHRELAAKIAALTEDLEELRSEKNRLLASLAYSGEDAADKFPKDIAAMEQSLKRLEEQEQKYSAELDAALNEYAVLRECFGSRLRASTRCSCMKQGRPSAPARSRKRRTGHSRFMARNTARC